MRGGSSKKSCTGSAGCCGGTRIRVPAANVTAASIHCPKRMTTKPSASQTSGVSSSMQAANMAVPPATSARTRCSASLANWPRCYARGNKKPRNSAPRRTESPCSRSAPRSSTARITAASSQRDPTTPPSRAAPLPAPEPAASDTSFRCAYRSRSTAFSAAHRRYRAARPRAFRRA